ncbi:chemotaxis protein CheX, partial [Fervidobacterium sp.]
MTELEKEVMKAFIVASVNVFDTLTGEKLVPKGVEQEEKLVFKTSGVVVIVSFTGLYAGRMLISMPKELAKFIYENGFGGENPTDNDLMLTANEFGNMVAGNAITEINNKYKGANLRLSPPSSFIGENLTFYNFQMSAQSIVLAYGDLQMKLNV